MFSNMTRRFMSDPLEDEVLNDNQDHSLEQPRRCSRPVVISAAVTAGSCFLLFLVIFSIYAGTRPSPPSCPPSPAPGPTPPGPTPPGPEPIPKINDTQTCLEVNLTTPNITGQYPFMASLIVNGSADITCGATIMSDQYLLTSASCVNRSIIERSWIVSWNQTLFSVKKVDQHDSYNKTGLLENDIALVLIDSENNTVSLNGSISPDLPLNMQKFAIDPINVTAVVNGIPKNGSQTQRPLMECERQLLTSKDCYKLFLHDGLEVNNVLCDQTANITYGDVNVGEAGGPLLVVGKTVTLVGIVSRPAGQIGAGTPAIYTAVADYTAWIKMKVGKKSKKHNHEDDDY